MPSGMSLLLKKGHLMLLGEGKDGSGEGQSTRAKTLSFGAEERKGNQWASTHPSSEGSYDSERSVQTSPFGALSVDSAQCLGIIRFSGRYASTKMFLEIY